jgi:hypothetical protein
LGFHHDRTGPARQLGREEPQAEVFVNRDEFLPADPEVLEEAGAIPGAGEAQDDFESGQCQHGNDHDCEQSKKPLAAGSQSPGGFGTGRFVGQIGWVPPARRVRVVGPSFQRPEYKCEGQRQAILWWIKSRGVTCANIFSNPNGVASPRAADGCNPFRVVEFSGWLPPESVVTVNTVVTGEF